MDVNIRAVALAGFIAIMSVPAVVEAQVYTAAFGRPPALYRNRHRDFNAIGWRSSSTLEINIEAYDDGEFHDHVLYHLDGTIERD